MARYFKCKDCEDRHPGCHSTCVVYKRAQEEWAKAKEYVRKDDDYIGYKHDSIDRYRSKRRDIKGRYR